MEAVLGALPILIVLGVWLFLQTVVLPRLGVST